MATGQFVSTLMPILKLSGDNGFTKKRRMHMYENEHLLYDIARSKIVLFLLDHLIVAAIGK